MSLSTWMDNESEAHIYNRNLYIYRENGIMIIVGNKMKLENVMSTEVNKAQKGKYHTFFLICGY